jgi:hypothetical protein
MKSNLAEQDDETGKDPQNAIGEPLMHPNTKDVGALARRTLVHDKRYRILRARGMSCVGVGQSPLNDHGMQAK